MLGEALPNALGMLVLNDNNHARPLRFTSAVPVWRLRYCSPAGGSNGGDTDVTRGLVWLLGADRCCRCRLRHQPGRLRTVRHLPHPARHDVRCWCVSWWLPCIIDRALGRVQPAASGLGSFDGGIFDRQHHAYALIAVPQGNEWQLILDGAKQVRLSAEPRPRIFAIASSPADISTSTIYHDEFGSLSSNSEWVPKEMFKRAMHDLHPEIANLNSRYDVRDRAEASGGSAIRRDHRYAPAEAVLHGQLIRAQRPRKSRQASVEDGAP